MTDNQTIKHPAKFSDEILDVIRPYLSGRVLDPFAGVGKLRTIYPEAYLLELEPEWAAVAGAIQGTVLNLPWGKDYFDMIVTSPPYGNRMSDSYRSNKKWTYFTYANSLDRPLTDGSGASMQWGKSYREFHMKAWQECDRVLKPGGRFILNISNHIRSGIEIDVTDFHHSVLTEELGYKTLMHYMVPTKRMRFGKHQQTAKVDYESVIVYKK
jgi:SAM-dependent methyltransferase